MKDSSPLQNVINFYLNRVNPFLRGGSFQQHAIQAFFSSGCELKVTGNEYFHCASWGNYLLSLLGMMLARLRIKDKMVEHISQPLFLVIYRAIVTESGLIVRIINPSAVLRFGAWYETGAFLLKMIRRN